MPSENQNPLRKDRENQNRARVSEVDKAADGESEA